MDHEQLIKKYPELAPFTPQVAMTIYVHARWRGNRVLFFHPVNAIPIIAPLVVLYFWSLIPNRAIGEVLARYGIPAGVETGLCWTFCGFIGVGAFYISGWWCERVMRAAIHQIIADLRATSEHASDAAP